MAIPTRRLRRDNRPILPTPNLMAHAKELLQHFDDGERFVLWDRHNKEIPLGEEIFDLLRSILIDLSQNRAIQILPHDMELTTVQAAEFLQVSRPHLVKIIKDGLLPCRMVGTHRRVKLVDLMKYRDDMAAAGKVAREEITKDAETSNWGY